MGRRGRRSRRRGAAAGRSRMRPRSSRRRAGSITATSISAFATRTRSRPGVAVSCPEHLRRVLAGDERRARRRRPRAGRRRCPRGPSARRRRPRRTGRSSRSEANHAVIPAISTAVVASATSVPRCVRSFVHSGGGSRSRVAPLDGLERPPCVLARAARVAEAGVRLLEGGAGCLEPVERHAVGREHGRDVRRGHAFDRDALAAVRAHRGSRRSQGRSSRSPRRASVSRRSRPTPPRAARARTRPRGDVRARSRSGGRRCPPARS